VVSANDIWNTTAPDRYRLLAHLSSIISNRSSYTMAAVATSLNRLQKEQEKTRMSHLARRRLPRIMWLGLSLLAARGLATDTNHAVMGNVGQVARTSDAHGTPRLPVRFEPTRDSVAESPASVVGEPRRAGGSPLPADVTSSASATDTESFPARGEQQRLGNPSNGSSRSRGAVVTAVGSLGLVLAVFFIFVWATRKAAPQSMTQLPSEVVESLGRTPLAGRQNLHLVRVGTKLILLSVTSTETRTLTEITDAAEVDRLAGLCQRNRPGSITATFRQVLSEAGQESGRRSRRGRTLGRAGEGAHA
jgi:flagellar biogenesis protein FliO